MRNAKIALIVLFTLAFAGAGLATYSVITNTDAVAARIPMRSAEESAEIQQAFCELAEVLYLNTLNDLAESLATAKNADDRLTIIAFYDTSIRRLENLPCQFDKPK